MLFYFTNAFFVVRNTYLLLPLVLMGCQPNNQPGNAAKFSWESQLPEECFKTSAYKPQVNHRVNHKTKILLTNRKGSENQHNILLSECKLELSRLGFTVVNSKSHADIIVELGPQVKSVNGLNKRSLPLARNDLDHVGGYRQQKDAKGNLKRDSYRYQHSNDEKSQLGVPIYLNFSMDKSVTCSVFITYKGEDGKFHSGDAVLLSLNSSNKKRTASQYIAEQLSRFLKANEPVL